MIASTALFPKFTNFRVPIYCSLSLNIWSRNEILNRTQENITNAWKIYKWNSKMKDIV